MGHYVMDAASMRNQYTFASFRLEHLASMAKLRFEEYGGQVAEHRRMLEWLMCRNPNGTGEASLAFLPDGSLAGMALNAAVPLAFKTERFNGRMVVCLLTRQDQRGGGLFIEQLRMVCRESLAGGARVVIGFPNILASLSARMLGRKVDGKVNCANQPLFLLAWISNRIPLPFPLRARWLDDFISKALLKAARPTRCTRLESLEGVRFEPEIAPNRLTIYADVEWLKWRYLQSPYQYTILAAGDPKRPDALAIVRTASNKSADGRELLAGYLMDVIRSSGAPSDAELEAARAGITWLRERGCHSVKSLFVRNSPYEALLSKVGFRTKRSSNLETIFFLRPEPNFQLPLRMDGYAITYSWADWI
jgi:hypothetical protein